MGSGSDDTAGFEEHAADAKLELSEQRFRGLFESAATGVVIVDLSGRFVEANEPFRQMVGYSLDELRSMDFLAITHPDDRTDNWARITELLAGDEGSLVLEKRCLHRDGSLMYTRVAVTLVRDSAGEPVNLAATVEDVTATRETRERLDRSDTLRRLAGDLALVGGWSVEATDERTVYWSDEIFRILDAPDADPPQLDAAFTLYPPPYQERIAAAIDACLADGTPFDLELRVNTYSGRQIPVRSIGEPERGPDGFAPHVRRRRFW